MSGILYSAIARNDVILVSEQKVVGNFDFVTSSMLPNIPTDRNTKTSYESAPFMYHVLVEDRLIYVCATNTEFGRRLPYAYLLEIKRRFTSGSLQTRAKYAAQNELDRDFAHVMKEQMTRFSSREGDQITQLQSQVDDVMGVMTQNIEKVLQRGEKIEVLLEKTTELDDSASRFVKSSSLLRRKMMCKNLKMWIIIGIVVSVVVTLIILMATNVIPVKSM